MQLVKNVPVSAGDARDVNSIPGWEDSLEQEMATTPVFLSGKFHAHRSLVGYSAWSHKELDMTEYTHIYMYMWDPSFLIRDQICTPCN